MDEHAVLRFAWNQRLPRYLVAHDDSRLTKTPQRQRWVGQTSPAIVVRLFDLSGCLRVVSEAWFVVGLLGEMTIDGIDD